MLLAAIGTVIRELSIGTVQLFAKDLAVVLDWELEFLA